MSSSVSWALTFAVVRKEDVAGRNALDKSSTAVTSSQRNREQTSSAPRARAAFREGKLRGFEDDNADLRDKLFECMALELIS